MPAYDRNMLEDATYWSPAGNDGYGGTAFNSPTAVKVRWQNRAVLFRDAEGRERTSEAVVYIDQDVETGGYLYRGVSAAAEPVDDAKEIRQRAESPALDNSYSLYKAML